MMLAPLSITFRNPLPLIAALVLLLAAPTANAQDLFAAWLSAAWPDAQKIGVTRATFDRETRGLAPDYSLPDLIIPGRPPKPDSQPEFVQTPADYLKETRLAALAAHGRKLAAEQKQTLTRIEREIGVPGPVLLAIFGRESDFGRAKLPHDALRVLATQGFTGRRKEQFRQEFLLALKMLQDSVVERAAMRSSWAGAMGLTQFLPSDYAKFAADFDGDGRKDIWNSVPDALGSAARQLAGKGWRPGMPWAIEVRAPQTFDCTKAEPDVTAPVSEWLKAGFAPVDGRRPLQQVLAEPASVLMPEGIYGPAFLTLRNYYVIKDYNFSDLYVLFVGNLADRIAGGAAFVTPWAKTSQLKTSDVETLQTEMTRRGLYRDKIDGKAGMKTRSAVGALQKASGQKLDCWPGAALLRAVNVRP